MAPAPRHQLERPDTDVCGGPLTGPAAPNRDGLQPDTEEAGG